MQKKDLKCAKRMIIKKEIELLYGHKKGLNWKHKYKKRVNLKYEHKKRVNWQYEQKKTKRELNKKYKMSELKE
jgi:hypothetical protein